MNMAYQYLMTMSKIIGKNKMKQWIRTALNTLGVTNIFPEEIKSDVRANNIEKIQELNELEEKDLVLKNLKLTEEVGELAQKVLIFKKTFGNRYRTCDNKDVLEEIADCYIVLMSMLFDESLDLNEADFNDKVREKLNKWESNLEYEESLNYEPDFSENDE